MVLPFLVKPALEPWRGLGAMVLWGFLVIGWLRVFSFELERKLAGLLRFARNDGCARDSWLED